MSKSDEICGAYQWGEPLGPDDNGGGQCTLKPGHTGSHVDHDNHYGPVIWDGRGNSATFDREKQKAFYERGQQEQAKMATIYAAQAEQDAQERSVTVTEFLLARITDDEADNKDYAELDDDDRGGWAILYAQRTLAECAAKRTIIELAQKASEDEKEYDDYEWQGTVKRSEPLTGDTILFALAAVYKDHPDYQQEWAA